jgi:hypothetical protein
MSVSIQKKDAMIRKPGVRDPTIDRFATVFVASHKAVREERLEE